MPRPAGSYRGARRNEAKQSDRPMLTLDEIRRLNALHAQRQGAQAPKAVDPQREELRK